MKITSAKSLKGEITVPGDKSISHRGILLGAISKGITKLDGFLMSDDCLSTISCFKQLGVGIEINNKTVYIKGNGLLGLKPPSDVLYTGNSGTTTRLLCGLLAGQNFNSILDGDETIRKRPMKRVSIPLAQMGADISCTNESFCPINIKGRPLNGITYTLPVASAQLKSAILLAGLYARGETTVIEPVQSRNHTELMLPVFGGKIEQINNSITVKAHEGLESAEINIPGDISSAAFFIVAGLIVPNSEILIKNVGINPTRTGILDVLINMGANITFVDNRLSGFEPVADILVKSSNLKGTVVEGDIIPSLIDEIPVIAVAAAFAKGKTTIKDAAELKVKESNRIDTVCNMLISAGVDVIPTDDGMIINGSDGYTGASFITNKDHRIAMSSAVLSLMCKGESEIIDGECASVSYPEFYDTLEGLKNE